MNFNYFNVKITNKKYFTFYKIFRYPVQIEYFGIVFRIALIKRN